MRLYNVGILKIDELFVWEVIHRSIYEGLMGESTVVPKKYGGLINLTPQKKVLLSNWTNLKKLHSKENEIMHKQ